MQQRVHKYKTTTYFVFLSFCVGVMEWREREIEIVRGGLYFII